MGIKFTGWGTAVPDRIVTNNELSRTLDTTDEWIFERTGIRERRVGGSTSSLGAAAARVALADAGVDANSIDYVILATTTPDSLIPATAPLIANDLGITAPAFDVNAACSGFMYAVRIAEGPIGGRGGVDLSAEPADLHVEDVPIANGGVRLRRDLRSRVGGIAKRRDLVGSQARSGTRLVGCPKSIKQFVSARAEIIQRDSC